MPHILGPSSRPSYRRSFTRALMGSAGLAVLATAAPALPALAQGMALEEITVTARKREEGLQSTPISIAAFTADDFRARGISDISNLTNYAPNVTIDATAPLSGSSNATSIFIRGVGQTDFVFTTDPGVGVYMDGVYIARSVGGLLDMMDVERVEVLRGPQGTLFGKNTIGGAVNVVTRKPVEDMEAEVEATYGRFDRLDLKGMVNIPLTDTLFTRISAMSKDMDGYGKRLLTGESMGGKNQAAIKAATRWVASENFEVNLSVDYTNIDEDSPVSTVVSGSRQATIGSPGTLFAGLLYNNLIGAPGGLPGTISIPALPADTVPYDSRWFTNNLFTSNATGPTGSKNEIFGFNGTMEWDLDAFSLKSITAYRDMEGSFGRDPDGSPLTMVSTYNEMEHKQFSQELQATGTAFDGRLQWLVGAYYLKEKGKEWVIVPFAQETFDILAEMGAGCTLFPGTPDEVALPFCPNIFRVDSVGDGVRINNESIAFFGEATFDITDQLALTVGLRWTQDKKGYDGTGTLVGGAPAIAAPIASEKFRDATPRVILDYKFTDDTMVYVSYSEGFKSGGFNQRYGAPLPAPTFFEPETVKSYEGGFKSQFWDSRARLNGAVFHSRYSDIQVVVFDGGIPRTINAAKGKITGFELEGTLLASENLLVQANYGYLDAEYTRLDPAIIGSFGVPIVNPLDLSYRFVNSPKHSLSLGAEYTAPVNDWGYVRLRGEMSHRSKWANDAVNTPELIQSSVTLFNARLTVAPVDEKWSLAVFGQNLSNRKYVVSGVADEPGFGLVELNAALPRTWGVTLNYRM